MKKIILLYVLTHLVLNASLAQPIQVKTPAGKFLSATSIDRIVHKLMDTAEVTGLCLAIIENKQVKSVKVAIIDRLLYFSLIRTLN